MKRTLAIMVLLVFVLAVLAGAQTKTVQLEYKLKPGDIDRYKMSMNMKMTVPSVPGFPAMDMSTTMTYKQKVLGVLPDGSVKIQISYEDLKVNTPGMPGQNKQAEQFKNMPPIVAVVGKDGRIINMEGMDQMLSGMGGMPGMNFTQMMGGAGFQGLVLPDKALQIGETWKQTVPVPIAGLNMDLATTLLGAAVPVGKDVAAKLKQDFKGHMDIAEMMKNIGTANANMPAQAQEIASQITGGGDIAGWMVYYFSPGKGKLLKLNGKFKMDMTMCFPENLQQQGVPKEMHMLMDMSMNMAKL